MNEHTRINYIGIIAGIVVFISLTLPWWTISMSVEAPEWFQHIGMSSDVFPYRVTVVSKGLDSAYWPKIWGELWYGWAALTLNVLAGFAAIIGSLIAGKKGKKILLITGISALSSIMIFTVGLHSELSKAPQDLDVSLFSSGSWSWDLLGLSLGYSSHLTIGFWLSLVAAIIGFISLVKHTNSEENDGTLVQEQDVEA